VSPKIKLNKVNGGAGYRWDVFLSYPRRPDVHRWVANVLQPQIEENLQNSGIGREVTIFRDETEIEAGSIWPPKLSAEHARSRVILAVLCFAYFESGWCCSEWKAAEHRDGAADTTSVIVPVRFNDLGSDTIEALPKPWMKAVKARMARDLFRYSQVVNRLSDTELSLKFREEIADLCLKTLKPRILNAPEWNKHWPTLPTEPVLTTRPAFKARLGKRS